MKNKSILYFCLAVISFLPLVSGDKIILRLTDEFYLDQKKEIIGEAKDIAVDEEENIYVADSKFHNIKIYNNKGLWIKTIGRRGAGPGEFERPCKIYYKNSILIVQDTGLYKYIILRKNSNYDFKEIKRFFYLVDDNKFVVEENRIISNDHYIDDSGKDYRGIILDFEGKVIKPLIPIPYPKDDGWNRITFSKSYVDVSKNGDIYFAKEREVKIYKFSRAGDLIKVFGQTPSYFRACKLTRDFEKAVFTSDPGRRTAWERWYSSFSWVSGLFVLDNFLGIVIRNFEKDLRKWRARLQIYDLNGNLLQDGPELEEIGTSSPQGFYLVSNHKDTIYIMEAQEKEEEIGYKFYKYFIGKK